jgi:hypothetical protein
MIFVFLDLAYFSPENDMILPFLMAIVNSDEISIDVRYFC